MPFATQDRPVPRKLLARAFALGNPLHTGGSVSSFTTITWGCGTTWGTGLRASLQGTAVPRRAPTLSSSPSQHEGHQTTCRPRPPTPPTACADTRRPASGRQDLSGCPETLERGSFSHTRSLGMREPSRRRSGEEDHDAVSSGGTARALARFPVHRMVRGGARRSSALRIPLLDHVKTVVSLFLKEQ